MKPRSLIIVGRCPCRVKEG